jgi:hypothetical protein
MTVTQIEPIRPFSASREDVPFAGGAARTWMSRPRRASRSHRGFVIGIEQIGRALAPLLIGVCVFLPGAQQRQDG